MCKMVTIVNLLYTTSNWILFLTSAAEQFRSSLDEHLGLSMTNEDFEHLVQKYGQEKPGRMNYKAFVEVMEKGKDKRDHWF